MSKRALIVVDMQNDFISGSLGTQEARAIVAKVKERIQRARGTGEDVIFTRDTHSQNYLCTQEGKNLPVAHCICGTFGWELAEGLAAAEEKVIDKPTFGSTELGRYAAEKGYEQIELIGVCTDICVLSNALIVKAFCPEAEISVRASCCAGVTPVRHATALEAMSACQIKIL